MKQFRAGFTRTNFSTQNLRGFTLIELLIVIALLGALAVGLLATIDPFEQLKKGRDTSQRNTTAEFYNANLRYYATKGNFPWGTGSTFTAKSVDTMGANVTDLIGAGDERARSLRIALVRTHCMGGRGFTYHLALDDLPAASDEVFEESGVTLYIDRAASGYLKGAALDYVETPKEAGFKLENPNAIAKCPCGHHDIFE